MNIKKLKFVFFILILFVAYFYLQYTSNITRIAPYPYIVKVDLKDAQEASKVNVLLMGDLSIKALKPAIEQALDEIQKNYNIRVTLFDWSNKIDTLSRVRTKIESLKKIPKVIIYHGTTNEMKEQKFLLKNINQLKNDINSFENPKILTALMLFPALSRFIYSNPSVVLTENVVIDNYAFEDKDLFLRNEYLYKLYEMELTELSNKVKNDNSVFLNITTPVDLEKKVLACQTSTSQTLEDLLLKIKNLLKEGKYKDSLLKLMNIEEKVKTNAEIYYLMGKIQLKMGNFVQAQYSLLKAHSLNCEFITNNPVFAGISKKVAKSLGTPIIDMFSNVNKVIGKDAIFLNGQAQEIYYMNLVNEIKAILKQALI